MGTKTNKQTKNHSSKNIGKGNKIKKKSKPCLIFHVYSNLILYCINTDITCLLIELGECNNVAIGVPFHIALPPNLLLYTHERTYTYSMDY